MDPIIILHAGLATGTILLFAAIGEIFAERAGILNLGVEGMMLLGAMAGFGTSLSTGNPWLGLVVAMIAGGVLSLAHGLVTIHFQADQVVSGLSLTFLGTGLALVLGEGLTGQTPPLVPSFNIPLLSQIPVIGPIFFFDHSLLVYVGYLFAPLTWYYIHRTRPGMHLRAVGEKPEAADTMGINVYRLRYLYVFVGGCLAGLAGATISLSVLLALHHYRLNSGTCSSAGLDLEITGNKDVITWGGGRPGRQWSVFALRADSMGGLVWAKHFDQQGGIQFIKELPSGDLLAGMNMDSGGAVVARMDPEGNFLWCRSYIRPRGMVHDARSSPMIRSLLLVIQTVSLLRMYSFHCQSRSSQSSS